MQTQKSPSAQTAAGRQDVVISLKNASPALLNEVKDIAQQYQKGYFDAFKDMYVYDNINNLPQVECVLVRNKIDDKIYKQACEFFANKYANPLQSRDELLEMAERFAMKKIVAGHHQLSDEFWATI